MSALGCKLEVNVLVCCMGEGGGVGSMLLEHMHAIKSPRISRMLGVSFSKCNHDMSSYFKLKKTKKKKPTKNQLHENEI